MSVKALERFKLKFASNEKDRYFFHDLINQTHNLNLFLENRISTNTQISIKDCQMLKKEINLMQSLIQNHFQQFHQNLEGIQEYVSFEYIKDGIQNMTNNFWGPKKIDYKIIYKGKISPDQELITKENCLVHYSSFYRILTNIIKNISEVHTDFAEMSFDYQSKGLSIVVKNKIFNLSSDSQTVEEKIQEIINIDKSLQSSGHLDGIGIASIASLCDNMGGTFNFRIEENYWINEIFLPPKFISTDTSENNTPQAA
ncbi:MAG: GHKL domain-containing protein [Bacteriovoracaceae bacterium]|nr:GHKL domain-containing protein [Bacteriovoracaceae bacterium]